MIVALLGALGAGGALGPDRRRARHQAVPDPGAERRRRVAVGRPLAARRRRLGHRRRRSCSGSRSPLVLGFALRDRPAPLRHAAARLLPAAGRLADRAGDRDRPDPGRLARVRDRPEAGDHRPRLLLPDHRQHPRRAALGRPRAAADDAHPRRRPVADPAPGRDPLGAAVPAQRGEDRRRDLGDRRRVRRVVGRRRGPRPPDPGRPGPAADGARVRRGRRPLGAGAGAVRRPGAGRAPARLVGHRDATGGPRDAAASRSPLRSLALALLAAGCGEKQERTRRRLRAARPWRSTSTSTPTTPGSTRRSSAATSTRPGSRSSPQVPSDPSAPIRQVAAGRADLAISYEPEVLLAQDQGLPVIAVAALVPQPLTSLISLPEAGIADPADLAGKTVATAGIPYQADYLDAILDRAGRRPRRRRRSRTSGSTCCRRCSRAAPTRCSAAFSTSRASTWRSAACTRASSRSTSSGSRPTTSSSWSPTTDRVADDPEPIRLFIAALERGTRAAVRDPQAATEAILDAGDGLEPKLTRAEVDRTLPLLAQRGPAAVRLHGPARVGARSPASSPTTA